MVHITLNLIRLDYHQYTKMLVSLQEMRLAGVFGTEEDQELTRLDSI